MGFPGSLRIRVPALRARTRDSLIKVISNDFAACAGGVWTEGSFQQLVEQRRMYRATQRVAFNSLS